MSLADAVGKETSEDWTAVARNNARARGFDDSVLTDDQISAVYGYTTNPGYSMLNPALRGMTPMTEELSAFAEHIDDGLNYIPPFKGTTYRGTSLPANVLEQYQEGNSVSDAAFLSTSRGVPFSGKINLEIAGISGRSVSEISQFPAEEEVLYPRNTQFNVIERTDMNEITKLDLEEFE